MEQTTTLYRVKVHQNLISSFQVVANKFSHGKNTLKSLKIIGQMPPKCKHF